MIEISGYRLERPIGRGGMSTVYLALQESVQREVALKVLTSSLSGEEEFSHRFLHEARIAAGLKHPNIVHVYDVAKAGDLHYIAMEYLSGGPLLNRRRSQLSHQEARQVLRQIGSALAYSHKRGVVHRDIKPDNILLREDGQAVLTDFGIARAIDSHRMTRTGSIVGTPHYMSPEQARGAKLDGRSDLYSLGIVLHEMLTGSVPFVADDPVAVGILHLSAPLPRLPAEHADFQPILDRLLVKDPLQRFQSGEELLEAMDVQFSSQNHRNGAHALSLESVQQHRPGKREPILGDGVFAEPSEAHSPIEPTNRQRGRQRFRGMTWGAAGMVALAVLVGAYIYVRDHLPQSSRTIQLDAANRALGEHRLDDDEIGLGARSLFQAILAEDPDTQVARDGLKQVARAYRDRAQEAARRGDWVAASEDIRHVEMLALPAHEWADLKSLYEEHQQAESQLSELLRLADEAMRQGRVESGAEGDGALAYYAEVLQRDNENAVALAGQRRALQIVVERVAQAIEGQQWNAADADLAMITRADPSHPELTRLQSALADAREAVKLETDALLDSAELALRRRQLDPDDPLSAPALFGRILKDQPTHTVALDGMKRVGRLLIELADAEAADFQFDAADALVRTARRLQPVPEQLDAFEAGLSRRRTAISTRTQPRHVVDAKAMISSAYIAMENEHWVEPPGSSAFDLIRVVLSSDPEDVDAKHALQDMGKKLRALLTRSLDANRPMGAWIYWTTLEAIGQPVETLQDLRLRLTASMLGHVAEQLGQGNLRNAERALEHAIELDPNHRDLPSLRARLETAQQGALADGKTDLGVN